MEAKVSPIEAEVNITSLSFYSKDDIEIFGHYKDPDTKDGISKRVDQTWICLKNNKETCSNIIKKEYINETGGYSLGLPPYSL